MLRLITGPSESEGWQRLGVGPQATCEKLTGAFSRRTLRLITGPSESEGWQRLGVGPQAT
jgi:hypothetical protein